MVTSGNKHTGVAIIITIPNSGFGMDLLGRCLMLVVLSLQIIHNMFLNQSAQCVKYNLVNVHS